MLMLYIIHNIYLIEKSYVYLNLIQYTFQLFVSYEKKMFNFRLLGADLSQEPKNKSQEYAQNEIIRLASESLAMQVFNIFYFRFARYKTQ